MAFEYLWTWRGPICRRAFHINRNASTRAFATFQRVYLKKVKRSGGLRMECSKGCGNLRKHGVSFDEAATVFFDPLSETAPIIPSKKGDRDIWYVGLAGQRG